MRRSLATSTSDPRVERLARVLADKETLVVQLTGAVRDLHMELTVRQDDDHETLFSQVSDLLDGLSAEAEVNRQMTQAQKDRG